MAGDDSRALARPARTYGMNLGGFFAGVVCCLCKARPGTSARPHRRGEKFPRNAFLFRHTRRKRCVVRDGHAAVHDASCAEAQPGKHRAAVTVSRQLIPCLYGCHDKRCFPGVLKAAQCRYRGLPPNKYWRENPNHWLATTRRECRGW
jgi:hypothetical protein